MRKPYVPIRWDRCALLAVAGAMALSSLGVPVAAAGPTPVICSTSSAFDLGQAHELSASAFGARRRECDRIGTPKEPPPDPM